MVWNYDFFHFKKKLIIIFKKNRMFMNNDDIKPFTYHFLDYQGYNHHMYGILTYGMLGKKYADNFAWLILGYIQKYQFYNWDEIKLNENVGFLEDTLKGVLDENETFSIENNVLTITSSNFDITTIRYILDLLDFEITNILEENNKHVIIFKPNDETTRIAKDII